MVHIHQEGIYARGKVVTGQAISNTWRFMPHEVLSRDGSHTRMYCYAWFPTMDRVGTRWATPIMQKCMARAGLSQVGQSSIWEHKCHKTCHGARQLYHRVVTGQVTRIMPLNGIIRVCRDIGQPHEVRDVIIPFFLLNSRHVVQYKSKLKCSIPALKMNIRSVHKFKKLCIS
jgi:hypothetical protein